ncbi:MAG TPA: hypothetical protein VGA63_05280 [Geopsychrobacteraceae bacterium]|jgi:hypothetical protein
MAVSKRSCRTLQDIHTLSGSFDRISRPDKAFMKIACLEMEKARRGTERENALHRLKNIDARLQEIEAEKAALLEALGERRSGKHAIDSPGSVGKSGACQNSRGFKLRY